MKLFVAYAQVSEAICKEIVTLLSATHAVWFDERRYGGQEWWQGIEERLAWCEGFIYLLSPHSIESQYCQREYDIALKSGKPIFPVVMPGWTPIPAALELSQYTNVAIGMENIPHLLNAIQLAETATQQSAPSSKFTLAEPFAWVDIPVGKVTIEAGRLIDTAPGIYTVPAFQIAQYPVTVAQYSQFVQAQGYADKTYWTDAGWAWKTQETITLPRYWEDLDYHKPDHPIVGVSWYEAIAFCQWLSVQTGENITLPTEPQWQRAAQGDDGREYAWGSYWDKTRCNHNIYREGQQRSEPLGTSAVTQYPQGASPYGVFDMTGNVCEWVLTRWEQDSLEANRGGIRGGSWKSTYSDSLRCGARDWRGFADRNHDLGIRLVRY